MESLEKKLLEIQDLMKKINLLPSPKAPQAPKMPSIAPVNQKNPVDQAQQIADPAFKKLAVKQAKALVKVDKNGQWSLDKNIAEFIAP